MKEKFNSSRYGADSAEGSVGDTTLKVVNEKGDLIAGDPNTAPTTGPQVQGYRSSYVDFTDAYANQGKVIAFTHVPSGNQVFFKAFITTYNETFNSNWKEETVYGRNDPIFQFQNTVRKITLAFKVPAATKSEAFENLGRVGRLAQFLYPYYDDPNNAATIAQSPLIRIKMMNMIASQAEFSSGVSYAGEEEADEAQYGVRFGDLAGGGQDIVGGKGDASLASSALLGVVSNLSLAHNLDGDAGVIEYNGGVLPKLIEVNLDFSVIHESPLGWNTVSGGDGLHFRSKAFPYGIDLGDEENLADSKGPKAIIAQNAQRFNQLNEERASEERLEEISQQAKENAAARYYNARGKLRQGRIDRDANRLARADKKERTSERLGGIAAAYSSQQGESAQTTLFEGIVHSDASDFWGFIE